MGRAEREIRLNYYGDSGCHKEKISIPPVRQTDEMNEGAKPWLLPEDKGSCNFIMESLLISSECNNNEPDEYRQD